MYFRAAMVLVCNLDISSSLLADFYVQNISGTTTCPVDSSIHFDNCHTIYGGLCSTAS